MPKSFDFMHAPGHLIRRAHQLSVAIFMEETAGNDVTPVQYAILNALLDDPGEDQATLAAKVAFDAATSGSVIGRLEARGYIRRVEDENDKRRKLLWLTDEGVAEIATMKKSVKNVQTRLMKPLDPAEREQFLKLLEKMVDGNHNDLSTRT